ncbi:MAG: RNA polymerase sigma factor [Caldilineales bacterium]|nr:RNA polymerase sigma factor [Caldilineales bacterium]
MTVERSNEAWLEDLNSDGQRRDDAIADLLAWLQRRLFFYLRSRSDIGRLDEEEIRQMAADFAQESVLIVLEKSGQFEGRSKFTTWAAKIGVHQALGELRRARWRDLSLDELTAGGNFEPAFVMEDERSSPEERTIQRSVMAVVMDVMQNELSDRQREALYGRLVVGVPIDIMAERMDTNPNALYKLMHDARKRLKARLIERGLSPDEVLESFS